PPTPTLLPYTTLFRSSRDHLVMTNRSNSPPSAESWRTVSVAPSTSATVSEWTLETNRAVNSDHDSGSSCCSGLYSSAPPAPVTRSEEHTSELQSPCNL